MLYGGLMLVMAFLSLAFGALAGRYARQRFLRLCLQPARGDLRQHPDAFPSPTSTSSAPPGLVTRMTTDVTNVQNAYQMILRIAVRAPLMLMFSYGDVLASSARS